MIRTKFNVLCIVILVLATAGIFQILLLGPSKADDDDAGTSKPVARLTVKNGVPTLTLTVKEQQNAGIIASVLEPAPAEDRVHGFGSVLDPSGLIDFFNQYHEAEAQLAIAKAKLTASQAAYQRAQVLNSDQQNISTAQLQTARSVFDVDTSMLITARTHAESIIATARQAWGEVIARELANSSSRIADLRERRSFLVRVTLPAGVSIATPPAVASAIYGSGDAQLAFVSLATAIDPKLQGVSYLYETQARNLLPGLNLDVSLSIKNDARGQVVPDPAIVWLDGKAWTYIRVEPTIFIRRQINPNLMSPQEGYIVTGFAPETQVVIQGAQILLSEEFRASVPVED